MFIFGARKEKLGLSGTWNSFLRMVLGVMEGQLRRLFLTPSRDQWNGWSSEPAAKKQQGELEDELSRLL